MMLMGFHAIRQSIYILLKQKSETLRSHFFIYVGIYTIWKIEIERRVGL